MSLREETDKSIINLRDPVWFREYFKIIMRVWSLELTMQQLAVVLFIFDRTAAWGKEWELIRYSSFVVGITSKDGSKRYAAGVCNSISTATRLTNELILLNMIVKRRSKAGNVWAINYNRDQPVMKTPRRLTRNQSSVTGSNQPTMKGSNRSPMVGRKYSKAIKGNASQKINPSLAAEGPSITEALANAKAKSAAARERRTTKRGGNLTWQEVSQCWAVSVQDAEWSDATDIRKGRLYLTKRESQALKSYSTRFAKDYPQQAFKEFLTWVIDHWPGLVTELFSWMTKSPPPSNPAALFIIKWAEKLEEKFMNRDAFETRLRMTPEEREISRLVKSGMSVDDAHKKAHPRKAKPKPALKRQKTKPFKDSRKGPDPVGLPSLENEDYAEEYES